MSGPPTLKKLRTAGVIERFSTAGHCLGLYNNVGLSAWYSRSSGSSQPLQSVIFKALENVIAEQSILSAVPLDEDKPEPYFARLPQIDLCDVVKYTTREEDVSYDDQTGDGASNDTELDKILEEQHNTNFYRGDGKVAPYWRLIIVTNKGEQHDTATQFVASFIYHHAIGDGASGKAFHRSFFAALQSQPGTPISQGEAKTIIKSPDTPLLPNLELLHPLPVSIFHRIKEISKEFFTRKPKGVWAAGPVTDSPSKRKTRYTSFALSKESTQSLVAASRAHSTTLTGTIQAALVAALFSHLPAGKFSVLSCRGAVSLRRWLPSDIIDDDSIGTFVSEYVLNHVRPASGVSACDLFSWPEARTVRSAIEKEINRNGKNSVVGSLKSVGNVNALFQKKVGKARARSLEVSNVGVYKARSNAGENSEWKSGKMIFSQSSGVVGPAITVSLITGADGRLTVGLCWLEGIVDRGFVEMVKLDTERVMEWVKTHKD